MRNTLITPPSAEIISLIEAKEALHVTHDHEDALITTYLKSAIRKCEKHCRMVFSRQTWEMEAEVPRVKRSGLLTNFSSLYDPDEIFEYVILPRRPVVSITSITGTQQDDGSTVTVDPAFYSLSSKGKLLWRKDFWPALAEKSHVYVRFVAGFESSGELTLHAPHLKEAILLALDDSYSRGMSGSALSVAAKSILNQEWTSPTYD